jgi:hypothetical protein
MASKKKVVLKIGLLLVHVTLLLSFLGLSGCPAPLSPGAPAAPSISFTDTTRSTSSLVYLSSRDGAELLYSLDCSTPSLPYVGPIPVFGPSSITVKAVASSNGQQSPVTAHTFPAITPFSFEATVDPVTKRFVSFNDIYISAWWDTSDVLHFAFTRGSLLDGKSWVCSIAGCDDRLVTSSQGSASFSWGRGTSLPQNATARIRVGQSLNPGENFYFEVTSRLVPHGCED